MTLATFALTAVLTWTPGPDAAELAGRLGSPRYAEREDAAKALLDLGRDAVPALREAKRSKDAEVRSRAAALLERIESGLMTRATLVALDFRDRPLPEVVKAVADRSHVNLVLEPANLDEWKTKTVTLVEPEPVPFWAAVDKLCQVGNLQNNPNMQWGPPGGRQATFRLHRGPGAPLGPTADDGPFRIILQSLHHHRDLFLNQVGPGGMPNVRVFRPGPAGPARPQPQPNNAAIHEQFYFQIQVLAEPRLMIQGNGVKLSEAVDELGQSLLLPQNAAAGNQMMAYYGGVGGASIQTQGHLKYPEKPGKLIKTLKGVVPVVVSTRKADPLTITLAGAKGKTFRSGDSTAIEVGELRVEPNQQGKLIDVTVRVTSSAPAVPGRPDASFQLLHNAQSQIELVDARDRPIQWGIRQSSAGSNQMQMTLNIIPNGDAGEPASLRFFELARASTEAAFEFKDIKMP